MILYRFSQDDFFSRIILNHYNKSMPNRPLITPNLSTNRLSFPLRLALPLIEKQQQSKTGKIIANSLFGKSMMLFDHKAVR
jgi:hypothetical protein